MQSPVSRTREHIATGRPWSDPAEATPEPHIEQRSRPDKAQMNWAHVNLGRPPLWRLKSAWWRDGSGQWSAAAFNDFKARYDAYLAREAKAAAHRTMKADLIASRRTPATREIAADEYRTLVSRIEALEAALRLRS